MARNRFLSRRYISELVVFSLCSALGGFFPGYFDFCLDFITNFTIKYSPSISETNRKWKTAKEEAKRETNSKRAR